jgi:hypothetical protein
MSRRMCLTVVAAVMAFQLGGAAAYAQSVKSVAAEIGFPFVAAGKDMPAGKYKVEIGPAGAAVLTGPDGSRNLLRVITTLGRHDQDPDAEFVFDKIDGKSVLSEIWMPKMDGLLVYATDRPHEHAVMGGSNPKK